VNSAGVLDEVETGPGVTGEEFGGEEVAFQAITASAGGDEVAGRVLAAFGEWENVIDGGEVEVQRRRAVDTAAAAVTHHGVFDGALLVAEWCALAPLGAASDSRKAW
jgi:hypothetical protein